MSESPRPVDELPFATHDGARLLDGAGAVALAEGVVEEARQDVAFLDRRAEILKEAMLRAVMHDEVGAGDEKLRRHDDRARIGNDALGRIVEREQDVDGDRAGDQRVRVVAFARTGSCVRKRALT